MQLSGQALPLGQHVLFASRDLDEARDRVARVFCPHRLDTIGTGQLDARHHHLAGERLSLNYIEYGAKTLIAPGELGDFYLLQIPLSGGAAIANGGDRYYSSPEAAAVLNPHLPTTMIWQEATRQVLVQIGRKAMQDHLTAQLGAPSNRTLTFQGPLDLTRGAGAALRRLVLFLVAEADHGLSPIGRGGLMSRQIESTVMAGLLEAHHHDHAAHLGRQKAAPRPRHLKIAETFIQDNLDRPVTIEDVAAAAGISPRGLQIAFRRFRNMTPLEYWRAERLARAHADLMAADSAASVTDIALRWGFSHFGRFSQAYRSQFGINPRDTLRAARGPGYQE
jgi:AraC-like DNA-binding protein